MIFAKSNLSSVALITTSTPWGQIKLLLKLVRRLLCCCRRGESSSTYCLSTALEQAGGRGGEAMNSGEWGFGWRCNYYDTHTGFMADHRTECRCCMILARKILIYYLYYRTCFIAKVAEREEKGCGFRWIRIVNNRELRGVIGIGYVNVNS